MRWPGWRRFWFAASCGLQAGDKPAIPACQVSDDVLHGPVTVHTGLIHARWADLIEKYFPLLIFFLQPIHKFRFLHVQPPISHNPINAESARLGVASPCLPVFQVTINSFLARVIPT